MEGLKAYSRHFASVGRSVRPSTFVSQKPQGGYLSMGEIVPWGNTKKKIFYFFVWGPTGDKNGLFTPFAKFLKICSVTFVLRLQLP